MSRSAAVLVLALGLSSACGSDSTPSSGPAPSSPATSTTAPAPSATGGAVPTATGPAFPADTKEDTSPESGEPRGLKVARAASQQGYDRVVFELGGKGAGQAGWRVTYVDSPSSDGSGDPVAVKGSAFLQVILTGVGYPADTGVPEPTTRRLGAAGNVREVVLDGVFEGQYTAFVGASSKLPFRVFRLSSPERIVVDLRSS
jgi:hypothetical protein